MNKDTKAPAVGHLTDADDHATIVDASTVPVLLDFYAHWCPPCRALSPHVDALAAQMQGKIKVMKVNIDDNSALSLKYQISSLPTLVLVLPGGKQVKHVGTKDLRQLTQWVEDAIK